MFLEKINQKNQKKVLTKLGCGDKINLADAPREA